MTPFIVGLQKNTYKMFLFLLRARILEFLLPGGSEREIAWLFSNRQHMRLLSSKRTKIILTRVRLFTAIFAVLTPIWGLLDVAMFPTKIWVPLIVVRLLAGGCFIAIYHYAKNSERFMWLLTCLLAIPLAIFTYSCIAFNGIIFEDITVHAYSHLYLVVPMMLIAAVSIFPLTVKENLVPSAMILSTLYVLYITGWMDLSYDITMPLSWLLMVLLFITVFTGVSQLAGVITLVRNVMCDFMTGCYSRSSGEELIQILVNQFTRCNVPLTIAFIDLDYFKQVNDKFGHDEGDNVLRQAVEKIRETTRASDVLIRWGGEEFLMIFQASALDQAIASLTRIKQNGFGFRPDNKPMTASIGVATMTNGIKDWKELVELADKNMYLAKINGRDQIHFSQEV